MKGPRVASQSMLRFNLFFSLVDDTSFVTHSALYRKGGLQSHIKHVFLPLSLSLRMQVRMYRTNKKHSS